MNLNLLNIKKTYDQSGIHWYFFFNCNCCVASNDGDTDLRHSPTSLCDLHRRQFYGKKYDR
jgi:hypothetical protein